MGAAAPALLGIGGILVFKEVADFIQIGLVAYQTGKKFSGSRSVRGGFVGIDGGTVRVNVEGVQFALPIDDAAAMAGVAGVAGRGRRSVQDAAHEAGRAGRLSYARALEAGEAAALDVYRQHNPLAGERGVSAVGAPNVDSRPFGVREFLEAQEQGKGQRQGVAIDAERQLEALRQSHSLRLEGIKDVRIREQLAAEFAAQERRLETQLQLQRERLTAQTAGAEQRYRHQLALDDREREWKGVQAVADRDWRERTQREQAEVGFYQKNLAADLAVDRAVGAARRIADVLTSPTLRGLKGAVSTAQITAFAGRFAGGVS